MKKIKKKTIEGIGFLLENSLFLIIGTLAALIWANINHETYESIIHGNLHFLVNEILMAFFFGLAAKEIFEAFLPGGDLSSKRKAATPIIATLGGIIGPAALYVGLSLVINNTSLVQGWAIPCATDIAFSYLIARLIFGKNHPAIPFLLVLAIADDAIGLIILAIFYPTHSMNLGILALLVGSGIALNLLLKKHTKIKNFLFYLIPAGALSWFGFYLGGIHPALCLVPIIPTFPHYRTHREHIFEEIDEEQPLKHKKWDTLNHFEHWLKTPVEFILMFFGFVNAGVALTSIGAATMLVTIGLLIGKPLGIMLFTFLAYKVFKLHLPTGMNWGDLLVVGVIAGIGFTVSLFIADIAFAGTQNLESAKMGALFSFAAAIIAILISKVFKIPRGKITK